jgi:hypothetical protein
MEGGDDSDDGDRGRRRRSGGACRVSGAADEPWGRRRDAEGSGCAGAIARRGGRGATRGGRTRVEPKPKKAHRSARRATVLPAERLAGRTTG